MTILKVNYETSSVEIAGRSFPCCGLVCPVHETAPTMTEGQRALGGPSGPGILNILSFQTCIPLENGAYVLLDCSEGEQTFDTVVIVSAKCVETRLVNGERDWLPMGFTLEGNRLLPEVDRYRPKAGHFSMWRDAEPEWVVELIDRVSQMTLPEHHGPEAVPVTLPELLRLWSVEAPGYLDA